MPRKHLRSIAASYETDETPESKQDAIELGVDLSAGKDIDIFAEDFYHDRASDLNGHSKNVQVTIPTTWGPLIQQILDAKELFPYRTAVEIGRDAMIHRLAWAAKRLQEAGHEVDEAWYAQVQMEKAKSEVEGKIKYLDLLEEDGRLFVQIEDWTRMLQLLWDAEQLPFPGNLKRRRDEIVRKYRAHIPKNYHPSYDTE